MFALAYTTHRQMTNTPLPHRRFLQIHPSDNVLVALTDLPAGERVGFNGQAFALPQPVAAKHKFTVRALSAGDPVTMYGVLVGRATQPVPAGGWLHTDNLRNDNAAPVVSGKRPQWTAPDISRWQNRTFQGYHRSDGSVGTANYWVVIPLVFCENRNLDLMREALLGELGYAPQQPYATLVRQLKNAWANGASPDALQAMEFSAQLKNGLSGATERIFPNVDGVKFLAHDGGCGCNRQDSDALCGLLAGYITHPNVAGATILSLGCQHAQFDVLTREIRRRSPGFDKPLYFFEQQQLGLGKNLLTEAIKATFAGLAKANNCRREPAPLSKLCLGLECGGSDGFSGISANPALGHASDLIAALGGSVILSEFPELLGVEQELCDRCTDDDTAARFIQLMRDYNARAHAAGSGFDMNPSPGNIRDGLITDAIKSAGAAKKGGASPVTDVLDYPEKVTRPGLNLLCTPGNDVESTTAEVASGATVVLFTTGLGTPTGNPIAPVIKIATNTPLFQKMPDIIDLDTGGIIAGEESIEQAGERILDFTVRVASGEVLPKAV
ncbi:MAG TPA: altronate dehydratase family protein, partial [Saprospiraceae bacterium]|nr:altronate dehydratase family protein [Saprospiraceae bacterium]